MNKQQLAAKIWQSANKMRSKIEANEYKDYILGFIFYKFLSDKLEKFVLEQGLEKSDFAEQLTESGELVDYIKKISVISSATNICFQLGWSKARILILPTFVRQ